MVTAREPRPIRLSLCGAWLCAAAALVVSGCNRDTSCAVVGDVLVNGKPADGVYLVFHPAADPTEGASVAVRTEEDGSFNWSVPQSGAYVVTAFWPEVIVSDEETIEEDDRFQGRYRQVKTPVTTIEIDDGMNLLDPLRLQL
jgi:hypothetical protein